MQTTNNTTANAILAADYEQDVAEHAAELDAAEAAMLAQFGEQTTAECAGCDGVFQAAAMVDGMCRRCAQDVAEYLADEAVNNTAEYYRRRAKREALAAAQCDCCDVVCHVADLVDGLCEGCGQS